MVAIPLGFLSGCRPCINKALDPFIQILKPISPLAWMPLALYNHQGFRVSADRFQESGERIERLVDPRATIFSRDFRGSRAGADRKTMTARKEK